MNTKLTVPPEFDSVPKENRIEFVQELWDRIAADPKRVPFPAEHQRILEARLDKYRADPKPGRSWSDVRSELLAKLRSS